MKKIKYFHLWLIAIVAVLIVFVAIYSATVVLAEKTDNVKSTVIEKQNKSLVKQDIQKLWTEEVILTRQYFASFTERLPDASTGAARLLILSTIMTIWLSTRYFTRLLS